METEKSLLKGAVLLTIAALFVKVLSAVYRVPFQNIVGDTGFYIYQQVYPFYGIAAGLAVSGFPVILSRIVAKADERRSQVAVHTAFITIGMMGFIAFLLLFFSSGWMASSMGDEALKPLIQCSALFFLFVPYIAVKRGTFQGSGNMALTASSQMAEQSVRIVAILLFSAYAVLSGRTLYEAGLGAVIGSLFGMAVSAFVVWQYSRKQKRSILFLFDRRTAVEIITRGTAVCLSALTLVFLQLADSFQVYSGLIDSDMAAADAKKWKGIFDRGQPLLQLGVVAAVSISLTIVPLISKAWKEQNQKAEAAFSQLALRVSFALGLAASAGLAAVMIPLNTMLFKTADGSGFLAVFGLSIFFYSLMAVMNAVFQGRGNDWIPAAGTVITVAVKWGANALLIPGYGLYGAAFATAGSLLAGVCFLSVMWKRKCAPLLTHVFVFKTTAAVLLMALVVFLFIQLIIPTDAGRIWNGAAAISGALLGACLFFVFMIKWRIWNDDDLRILPFGEKLAKRAEMRTKRK
ncbi:polysaccharide biosynthesis protein [Domibacillus sp. A3M-37]|uniref:putative polysaccharide biosynthesis protein n=1 Tax=Domibacillus sp. A3M-37 TaxID=2962037 RepID=UPI0020B818AA|nr:polysaccharide biosynthesis protein [Domibacillus sp. A3M-37]MCP3764505.1 polysaccharide biosynthesis protein [Domibacillus sp. A3M-37]